MQLITGTSEQPSTKSHLDGYDSVGDFELGHPVESSLSENFDDRDVEELDVVDSSVNTASSSSNLLIPKSIPYPSSKICQDSILLSPSHQRYEIRLYGEIKGFPDYEKRGDISLGSLKYLDGQKTGWRPPIQLLTKAKKNNNNERDNKINSEVKLTRDKGVPRNTVTPEKKTNNLKNDNVNVMSKKNPEQPTHHLDNAFFDSLVNIRSKSIKDNNTSGKLIAFIEDNVLSIATAPTHMIYVMERKIIVKNKKEQQELVEKNNNKQTQLNHNDTTEIIKEIPYVLGFGSNSYGQLGIGGSQELSFTPTPILRFNKRITSSDDIVQVFALDKSTILYKTNQTKSISELYLCGDTSIFANLPATTYWKPTILDRIYDDAGHLVIDNSEYMFNSILATSNAISKYRLKERKKHKQ